jgi:branched-chain amino acid transport system substrate-binding protein
MIRSIRVAGGWTLALVLAPLVVAGCGGKAEPPPVWFGHISPLSGPDQAVGRSARNGVLQAVEEANQNIAEGAGRPVRVRHTYTHGKPGGFGATATRLVAVNHVTALLGGQNWEEIKEFKRLDRDGVFLVSPTGFLTPSESNANLFFTGLSARRQGAALARFAADKGFARVVVLVNAKEHADRFRAVAQSFADTFPTLRGKKRPRRKPVLLGPKEYGNEVSIKERADSLIPDLGRTDAMVVAGTPADVKRLRAIVGMKVPVLFAGEEGSLRALLEEEETRSGVYLATAFTTDAGTGQVKEFVKKYRQRFREAPDVYAALAYDSARMLFTAVRKAETTESVRVRDELAGLKDLAGLTGPLTFDSHHQVTRDVFIVRIHQGKPGKVKRYPAGR